MLRTADGAVSGQGSGILVFPEDGVDYAGRFRWDLSDLAPGSITTSGLTDDNDVRAPLSTLSMNFFMAGPLHRYPASGRSRWIRGVLARHAAMGCAESNELGRVDV